MSPIELTLPEKPRKKRPYRTEKGYTPVHVLILTEQEIADDAFEHLPSTTDLLHTPIE